jgi:hypothetical protein
LLWIGVARPWLLTVAQAAAAPGNPPTAPSLTTTAPAVEHWDVAYVPGGLPSNAMASYTPPAGPSGPKNATAGEQAESVAQQVAIAPGVSSTTSKFLWDVTHAVTQVALERDAADVLQRRYLYGHGRLAQTAGTPSYYHADPLGSVAHLASDTGTIQRTLAYEPFGVERTNTGPGPGSAFRFTGEQQDATGPIRTQDWTCDRTSDATTSGHSECAMRVRRSCPRPAS